MQSDALRTGAIFRMKPATPNSASKAENSARTFLPRTPQSASSLGSSGAQGARTSASAPQSAIQQQFDQLYRATPLPMALVRSLGGSGMTPPPVVAPSPLKPMPYSPLEAMHAAASAGVGMYGVAVPYAMQHELALAQSHTHAHTPMHHAAQQELASRDQVHLVSHFHQAARTPPMQPPPPVVHNLQPPRSFDDVSDDHHIQQDDEPLSEPDEEDSIPEQRSPPKVDSLAKLPAPTAEAPVNVTPAAKQRRGHAKLDSLQLMFASPSKQVEVKEDESKQPPAATKAASKRRPRSVPADTTKPATTKPTTKAMNPTISNESRGKANPKSLPSKKRARSAMRDIESTKPFGASEQSNRKRKSGTQAPLTTTSKSPEPSAERSRTPAKEAKSKSAAKPKSPVMATEPMRTAAPKSWTEEEIHNLHVAHSSLPVSDRNFWRQVAKKVPGRTAEECQAQWFAAVPVVKKKVQAKKRVAPEHISSLPESSPVANAKAEAKNSGAAMKPPRKPRAAVVAAQREMFATEQDDLFNQTPMKIRKRSFDERKVIDIPTPAQRRPSSSDLDGESFDEGNNDDDEDDEDFEPHEHGDDGEAEIDSAWKHKVASRMRRGRKLPSSKRIGLKKAPVPKPVQPGHKLPTKKRKNVVKELVSSRDGSEYQVHASVSPGGTIRTSVKDDDNNEAFEVDIMHSDSDSEGSDYV